ncbi:acidic mammalian chitinase-like [Lithobates pipiens]
MNYLEALCFAWQNIYFYINGEVRKNIEVTDAATNTKIAIKGSAFELSCYFTNWAQYRPGLGKFKPDNIDPCLCTHLIYAFAGMSNNQITTIERNDVTLYSSFQNLKNQDAKANQVNETKSHSLCVCVYVYIYDLHGSWEGYTGANAYLTVDYVMNNGAPASKLIVGFPTYGHTFILSNPSNTAIGAPTSGAGPAGPYTRQSGFWAYYEICTFLKNGATNQWSSAEDVPFAYQGNEWLGYDNQKSFQIKAEWLVKNNFAGAMVWAIDLDDFTGTFCNQGKYPLISTLNQALGIQASGCTPPSSPNAPITAAPATQQLSGGSSGGSSGSSFGSSSGGSGFCAGKASSLYPVPGNKHAFWHCLNGVTYQQNCQAGLVFDPSCECCNWAYSDSSTVQNASVFSTQVTWRYQQKM